MNEKNIVRLLGWNLQMGFRALLKEYKESIYCNNDNHIFHHPYILKEYKESIYWHIRRITVNAEDAKDATQETFIRVFRSFGQYDRSRSFKAWLYRIATNEARRIIEKRHPTVNIEDNAEAMSMLADEHIDMKDIEAVNLQKAIHSLPRKQQLTFNLRYYDELSFDEIAEITDSTPDSAKANWHNAKVKIYDYLKEYYG